jgi:hypothetical protein
MRKLSGLTYIILCGLAVLSGCNKPAWRSAAQKLEDSAVVVKNKKLVLSSSFFNFSVNQVPAGFPLPALHSFASASYNGLWIFIGGVKNGFHGRTNSPPPFKSHIANDSIWVVDFVNKQSWGVPVPQQYFYQLTATNPQYCQSDTSLYFCGGFVRTDSSSARFNSTSSMLFEFNLANLVQYVQSGGSSPSFGQVITKAISSPYLQVAGGEMLRGNGNFYLIGGQNYNTVYSTGANGIYTNAVRKFNLQQINGAWTVADTVSVTDPVNLHRRDMNVIPYDNSGRLSAILYGGVFTAKDQAYLNPVTISGLDTGQPVVSVADSMQQMVNQYTSAKATINFGPRYPVVTALLGGISYEEFNPDSNKLVIGDGPVPMPFSNLVSIIFKYQSFLPLEYIQLPPAAPLLPAYIGSNAQFIPLPQFALAGHPDMLDGEQIINAINGPTLLIGYIYGGILSLGPTSGTTPNGYIATYANPNLYAVYLNFPDSLAKKVKQ